MLAVESIGLRLDSLAWRTTTSSRHPIRGQARNGLDLYGYTPPTAELCFARRLPWLYLSSEFEVVLLKPYLVWKAQARDRLRRAKTLLRRA